MKKKTAKKKMVVESAGDAPVAIPDPEAEPSGFICPRCRFRMRVYKTKSLNGGIYRIRVCDRCSHKIDTEEGPIG